MVHGLGAMEKKKKQQLYTDGLCFDIVPTADNDECAFKSPAVVETSSKPTHNNFSSLLGGRGDVHALAPRLARGIWWREVKI